LPEGNSGTDILEGQRTKRGNAGGEGDEGAIKHKIHYSPYEKGGKENGRIGLERGETSEIIVKRTLGENLKRERRDWRSRSA